MDGIHQFGQVHKLQKGLCLQVDNCGKKGKEHDI